MVLPPVKGHVHRCKTLEDRGEGERNGGERTVEKESGMVARGPWRRRAE